MAMGQEGRRAVADVGCASYSSRSRHPRSSGADGRFVLDSVCRVSGFDRLKTLQRRLRLDTGKRPWRTG